MLLSIDTMAKVCEIMDKKIDNEMEWLWVAQSLFLLRFSPSLLSGSHSGIKVEWEFELEGGALLKLRTLYELSTFLKGYLSFVPFIHSHSAPSVYSFVGTVFPLIRPFAIPGGTWSDEGFPVCFFSMHTVEHSLLSHKNGLEWVPFSIQCGSLLLIQLRRRRRLFCVFSIGFQSALLFNFLSIVNKWLSTFHS